jgi:hypothetical protein
MLYPHPSKKMPAEKKPIDWAQPYRFLIQIRLVFDEGIVCPNCFTESAAAAYFNQAGFTHF